MTSGGGTSLEQAARDARLLKDGKQTDVYKHLCEDRRAHEIEKAAKELNRRQAHDTAAVRFTLWWAAATLYWRERSFTSFGTCVDALRETIKEKELSGPQKQVAQAYLCTLVAQQDLSGGPDQYDNALRAANQAIRSAAEAGSTEPRGGACNIYAEVVASQLEHAESDRQARRHKTGVRLTEEEDKRLREALEHIDRAIGDRRDYAKYHANKARLLGLRREDRLALQSIVKAMELEPADGAFFDVRIVEYTAIRERNLFRAQFEEALADVSELRNQVKDSESKLIQVVGLLSGIVALVVAGGAAGSATRTPPMAATVVLTLALSVGLLVLLFGYVVGQTSHRRALGGGFAFVVTIVAVGLLTRELL